MERMHSKSQAQCAEITDGPQVRRGRPRGFDEEEATERLLELFWSRGYDQVGQDLMAKTAGISTSSLYRVFGTKPEIYERVLKLYAEQNDAAIEPLLTGDRGADDILDFLDQVEERLASKTGESGCMITNSMATMGERDRQAAEIAKEYRQNLRSAFRAALERGSKLGENVPPPDAGAEMLLLASLGTMTVARACAADRSETAAQLAALRTIIGSWR